jgi:hypothetical protein
MTIAISAHDKRVLIVGSAALVFMIGGTRFASRAVEWSARSRASAASLVAAVATQEASIRALPRTRDSLVGRRVRLAELDSTILGGDTPALAGAALAELVSDVAEATKAQAGNVQVRTDSSARGTFVAVQVQASITGDLFAVTRFLAMLESGPKLVALREVGITAQADPSGAQGPARRETIRADVVVEGLARNPSSHSGEKQ